MKNLADYKDLILDKKAFINLALVKKNGKPHISPIWFDSSEKDLSNNIIFINTAKGRVKAKNLKKGTIIAASIMDPDNSYRYIGFEGEVLDEIIGEEAETHIDNLSYKYTGREKYPHRKPGEIRIKYPIRINHVYN